jgi:hypothetical protein
MLLLCDCTVLDLLFYGKLGKSQICCAFYDEYVYSQQQEKPEEGKELCRMKSKNTNN